MVVRIRRVNVLQCAFVVAILYALVSLVFVVLFLPFLSIAPRIYGTSMPATGFILLLPVGYAIGGFIAALIAGAIYNLVAGWTGGFELSLNQVATMEAVADR